MRIDGLELRVPPLLVTMLAAAAIVAIADTPRSGIALLVGATIAVAGAAVAVAGVIAFRRALTTVDPLHPDRSASLVTQGVYRISRNPMYVGFIALLLGLAVALSSIPGGTVALAAALYLDRFQIRPEERILQRRFGAAFDRYRASVRRWL
jgi:protein-S-isoprenylcysteine O-methyltransferase Ste14